MAAVNPLASGLANVIIDLGGAGGEFVLNLDLLPQDLDCSDKQVEKCRRSIFGDHSLSVVPDDRKNVFAAKAALRREVNMPTAAPKPGKTKEKRYGASATVANQVTYTWGPTSGSCAASVLAYTEAEQSCINNVNDASNFGRAGQTVTGQATFGSQDYLMEVDFYAENPDVGNFGSFTTTALAIASELYEDINNGYFRSLVLQMFTAVAVHPG